MAGWAKRKAPALPRKQVFIGPSTVEGKLDVQVGVGYQNLSPVECRQFASALATAAAEMEDKA